MDLPCQKIVIDVIPAIRASLAIELSKMGLSNLEISKLLDIASSAVSQYLSGKRGYRVVFENEIKEEILILAHDLKSGKEEHVNQRICRICRMIRENCGCSTDDGCI